MGQSSSQVAPSQVPSSARSFISKVMPWDATPRESRKRSRPANDEEEDARKPKKLRHDERRPSGERKTIKAVPQHRRGTSIKPLENGMGLDGTREVEQDDDKEIVVATPKTKNRRSQKHSPPEVETESSLPEKKRKKAKTSGEQVNVRQADDGAEVNNVQPTQPAELEDFVGNGRAASGLEGSMHKDGVVVSPNGQPGPKRKARKEKKSKTQKSTQPESDQVETVPDTQSQHPAVQSDGVSVSVIDEPGPKRKKKTKPSAVLLPTPSEGEHSVVDPNYDSNESESEYDEVQSKRSRRTQKHAKPAELDITQPESNRKDLVDKSTTAEEADTRPVRMKEFQTAERGTLVGPWAKEELDLADQLFKDFCRDNNMHETELKNKTTKWASLGPFKTVLYEAFPKRSLDNVRKHMQRRFSPYDKGPWGEEEIRRLKDAYAKYPDQWPEIAREVGRGQQACRDRWVNSMKYEDTMDRGAWSIAEEAKLVKIVEAAVALIVQNTDDSEVQKDRLEAEAMLNWADVASKMDGKRSQKRCFEKWRLLKRRSNKPRTSPRIAASNTHQDGEQKPSRKKQDLERQYAKMKPGDVYAALQDFMWALNVSPNSQYHDDSTFWSVIAQNRDRFKTFTSTPLVRHTYLNALVTYNCKRLRRAEGYPMKLLAIMNKMKKLERRGKLDLEERAFGPIEKEEPTPKQTTNHKKCLSKDIIHSSDDEAETAATTKRIYDDADVDDELVVPETQPDQIAGAEEDLEEEEEDETVSLRQQLPGDDQDAESLRSETPHLAPEEFLEKCRKVGKKQHRAFLKGYGR